MGSRPPRTPRDRDRELQDDVEASVATLLRAGQRLSDFAEEAGVRRDVFEGTGDLIYEAVLQQIQVTNRALQSSFRLTDAILQRAQRPAPCEVECLVVEKGKAGMWSVKVRNAGTRRRNIEVSLSLHDGSGTAVTYPRGPEGWTLYFARPHLDPGQSTLMRVDFATTALSVGAYLATVKIKLVGVSCTPLERVEEVELHVVQGELRAPSP